MSEPSASLDPRRIPCPSRATPALLALEGHRTLVDERHGGAWRGVVPRGDT